MRNLLVLILSISLLSLPTYCVPIQDLVSIAQIPYDSKHLWYSGYLQFTGSKFHYVFFDSQRDPDNDPLILWLNGGPGCSSLIGMVYENGPFLFAPNSTDWVANPYSWNLKANLLYIESPGGVGFSTSDKKVHSDQSVAKDNLEAVLTFFRKFPNLRKNDFYISGESYAGIYIPTLAHQIINYNRLPSAKQYRINLKGILVGNGCTDPRQCYEPGGDDSMSIYQYQFLYKHGYLTQQQYDLITGSCTMGYNGKECKEIRNNTDVAFYKTKTSILNIYGPCYNQKPTNRIRQSGKKHPVVSDDTLSCDDSLGIHHFFNTVGINKDLHVDPIHYEMCSDDVANNYVMNENASYWLYPILIRERLRIWVYSGDVDADVPITGTVIWLERLAQEFGLPVVEPWREWWVPGLHKHEDQVGGMVWQLRGLTFASVKGAGHQVPRDKHKQAYVLIDSFLNGVQLPFKTS